MTRISASLRKAREKAEQAQREAEKAREAQIRKLSLEFATKAASAYNEEQLGEAVKAFQGYLRVMEQAKNVRENCLTPQHFDQKKEAMQLLLIAGVYWDLAKIFDRVKKPGLKDQYKQYLQKFILFSKDMPYTPLCAESLRKFIDNGKALHRSDFSAAYTTLTGQKKCFVATALMDVSDFDTLPRLRRFRDEYLRERAWGRAFTKWYYEHGPRLAAVTERLPRPARRALAIVLDHTARVIDTRMRRG